MGVITPNSEAPNILAPGVGVFGATEFDLPAVLGGRLDAIAGEKAGILKAGVPAVFARQRSEVAAVLELRAAQLSISVARTEAWSIEDLEIDPRGSRFLLSGELDLKIVCPLAGEHQVENAATAAVALTRLGISEPEIIAGIAQTRWPGRLECVSEHPEIILDGAHN